METEELELEGRGLKLPSIAIIYQRSSARFVMGDFDRTSSVTAMLKDLHWPSLQDRRLQNRLIMLYKIRFGLVDIPWNSYLTQLSKLFYDT